MTLKAAPLPRGHLDPNWVFEPMNDGEDPWIITTTTPTDLGHRDACLGNGLIGTRVHAWGDATGYEPGSSSFMSGLWGAATDNPERPQGLVELPHWATLTVSGGDRELRRSERRVTNHQQSLSLRTATAQITWREETIDVGLEIDRATWVARHDRHIGVLEMEVTLDELSADPLAGTVRRLFFDEELDALHIPDTSENRTFVDGEDLCLVLKSNLFGHELVVRSRLLLDLPENMQSRVTESLGSHVCRRRVTLPRVPAGSTVRVTKMVAIVSSKQEADPLGASRRFLDAAANDPQSLRQRHLDAWKQLWQSRVESPQQRFAQLANACLYTIYSCLRDDQQESHGPCGLFGNGWDGNVFWDTELWTLPAMALFQPGLAKSCAAYRVQTLAGAYQNGVDKEEVGARYAWQSGETGEEACSMPVFQDERHIVSCVAMGQWLYAKSSGDEDWLKNEGLKVFRGCAEYWAGRAEFDEADGRWHINNVCGSDEHAGYVDDNATTNWGASWTLRTAAELVRAVGEEPPVSWEEIAEGIIIPWDEERDIPLQMKQWEHGQIIKQADAVMLIHPWNYPMDAATKARTVDYYRAHYQSNPIMMGYAIDGIIDSQLGRQEEVTAVLREMTRYFRHPYFVATEASTNERLPFLTGLGGFLQLILHGFAGISLGNSDELEIGQPCLPVGIDSFTLHGIHRRGRVHRVEVQRSANGSIATATVHAD